MKKVHRDKALAGIYEELKDADFDVRENALFQLGLLLERSNEPENTQMPDVYEDNLSRDMLKISLSDAEQNKVIAAVSQLIATRKDSRQTGFWVMSKVKGELAFAPMLALIKATGNNINNEAAFQICFALRKWLESGIAEKEEGREQLKMQDPTSYLEKWQNSKDERLAETAKIVLELLD